MAISPKNKIDASFSVSSMTDIVFLLLIFFMVTSTFIQTKGIVLEKPKSETANSEAVVVTISIDKNGYYYFEQERASLQDIEYKLTVKKRLDKNLTVLVNAEKTVSVEQKLVLGTK